MRTATATPGSHTYCTRFYLLLGIGLLSLLSFFVKNVHSRDESDPSAECHPIDDLVMLSAAHHIEQEFVSCSAHLSRLMLKGSLTV
jgi:hypothetical protein